MVSIVIPAYGREGMTRVCVERVIAVTAGTYFEIVVVDDASDPPMSLGQAGQGPRVRIVRLSQQGGFGAACNEGARSSEAAFLLFLNNDTLVEEGWLDALLVHAVRDATVGAVGSALFEQSGQLQELGSAVYRGGRAWNYGSGEPPDDARFRVVREPDYCSAASLLVRRDVFVTLGGFDQQFAPGYYEDVDLAFGIRALGYRVVVEPQSWVVHLGRRTFGRDAKREALLERNRVRFEEKWSGALADHAEYPLAKGWLQGGRHQAARVLLIDRTMQSPDRNAGGLRAYAVAETLRELGCQVTMLLLHEPRHTTETERLEGIGVEVFYGAHELRQLSFSRSGLYDLIIVTWPDVADELYLDLRAAFPHALLVFDTVDLHHRRLQRQRALGTKVRRVTISRFRAIEHRAARSFDVTLTVSEEEASEVRAFAERAEVRCLPLTYDAVTDPPGFDERSGALFVGNFVHPPNVDAAIWLVEEIWPKVDRACGRLTIAGPEPPAPLARAADDRVEVLGYVPDLAPLYDRALMCVAPVRFGAGVKGKNAQALASGVPLVTTTAGAAGMRLVNGENVLIADDAAGIAGAIASLQGDPDLWRRIAAAGWRHAEREFGRGRFRAVLSALVSDAVAKSRNPDKRGR